MGESVEPNRRPDYGRIAPETTLPESKAQDGRHGRSRGVLLGSKGPPDDGSLAEHLEETIGDSLSAHCFRLVDAGESHHVYPLVRGHALERSSGLNPIEEGWRRDAPASGGLFQRVFADPHEPFGMLVGKRLEQDGVSDGKDSGRGTYAETERENRHRHKARALQKPSPSEANVPNEPLHRTALHGHCSLRRCYQEGPPAATPPFFTPRTFRPNVFNDFGAPRTAALLSPARHSCVLKTLHLDPGDRP